MAIVVNLDAAVQQRQQHRPDPLDWAQLCTQCAQPWPCETWRKTTPTILDGVRQAFAAARLGGQR